MGDMAHAKSHLCFPLVLCHPSLQCQVKLGFDTAGSTGAIPHGAWGCSATRGMLSHPGHPSRVWWLGWQSIPGVVEHPWGG